MREVPAALDQSKTYPKIPIIKPNLSDTSIQILEDLKTVVESNMVSGVNIKVKEFENDIKNLTKINSLAVSSCSLGMILAIHALGLRRKEIIMPSFSFSATAHMAYWNNCPIVFSDIDAETLNIDVSKLDSLVSEKTGAILAVHMYGNPAPIKELADFCEDKNLKLLFDGAHALGSKYNGQDVGNFGDVHSFSLSPTKVLTAVEGGIISSPHNDLIDKMELLRNYGNDSSYNCPIPGFNARMSEFHAVVGLHSLKSLGNSIQNRERYVKYMKTKLKDISGLTFQKIESSNQSTHKDFSIIVNEDEFGMNRSLLAKALSFAGISTKFYFYPPMHQLDPYVSCQRGDLSITEFVSNNVLSLPIWNEMPSDVLDLLINEICLINENASKIKKRLM